MLMLYMVFFDFHGLESQRLLYFERLFLLHSLLTACDDRYGKQEGISSLHVTILSHFWRLV
jgi:hypothetical protein